MLSLNQCSNYKTWPHTLEQRSKPKINLNSNLCQVSCENYTNLIGNAVKFMKQMLLKF